MENPVALELAQLVGQYFLGNFGELATDLREAAWSEGEMPEDLNFPFAGKNVDGSLNGTAVMVFHGFYLQPALRKDALFRMTDAVFVSQGTVAG